MPEFGGLRKNEKTQHELVGLGFAVLAATAIARFAVLAATAIARFAALAATAIVRFAALVVTAI